MLSSPLSMPPIFGSRKTHYPAAAADGYGVNTLWPPDKGRAAGSVGLHPIVKTRSAAYASSDERRKWKSKQGRQVMGFVIAILVVVILVILIVKLT